MDSDEDEDACSVPKPGHRHGGHVPAVAVADCALDDPVAAETNQTLNVNATSSSNRNSTETKNKSPSISKYK
jgi:hypothetical protein